MRRVFCHRQQPRSRIEQRCLDALCPLGWRFGLEARADDPRVGSREEERERDGPLEPGCDGKVAIWCAAGSGGAVQWCAAAVVHCGSSGIFACLHHARSW